MAEKSRLTTRHEGDTVVVRFQDRKIMDLGTIEAMATELFDLASSDGIKLALNFQGVDFLASAALNKVLSLERKVKGQGGRLAICCLSPTMRDVFHITRLGEVFDIYPEESQALESLA